MHQLLSLCFATTLAALAGLCACTPTRQPDAGISTQNQVSLVQGQKVQKTDWISRSSVGLRLTGQAANESLRPSLCSATLIQSNIVITAAHCVSVFEEGWVVFSGDLNDSDPAKARRILKVLVHPGYILDRPEGSSSEDSEFHDLALVLFDGEIPAGFQPVEMLTDEKWIQPGLEMIFAGFGLTSPEGNSSPVYDKGILRRTVLKFGSLAPGSTDMIFPKSASGASVCNGDSGGSVYLPKDSRWFLAGVISRGENQDCRSFSVATNVAAHSSFIKKGFSKLLNH